MPRSVGSHRRGRLVAGVIVAGALVAGCSGASEVRLDATSATTVDESRAVRETTTTERQKATTTTLAESPEGGIRTASAEVAAGDIGSDELGRARVEFADVARLDALAVEPERKASSYDRALFRHWDDVDGDGCDTRCEVLTSQRLPDGSWFSEWDGATEVDSSLVHIDHVVALAEAWRSGAHGWTPSERDEFADDRANLVAVTASSNLRKRDHDAANWFPSRSEANCLWARTTVIVKGKWSLSVDAAEKDALGNLLRSCGAVPPTTTTAPPPSTTAAPAPPPPPPPPPPIPPEPTNDCSGYSPCLPPGPDVDCASGSGNGPRYTGRVTVDHGFGDPFDLDRDGDGVGCE